MIQFFLADISYSLRDKGKIRNWLSLSARSEKYGISGLNIILCSDEYLYRMNVQYLHHRTYTDIITFDQSTEKRCIDGELYISIERVRENAAAFGISLRDELHRVMVHGLLHLCGYTDKDPRSKLKMARKEDKYLYLRNF